MSAIRNFISEYDGSCPEEARLIYERLMSDCGFSLKQAAGSTSNAKFWLRLADENFEAAQLLGDSFKKQHQKYIEGDEIKEPVLELRPPEDWEFLLTSNEIDALYEHLCEHYPWLVPTAPSP